MKVLHTCNSISPGSTDAHHLCLLVHSAPHPSHPSLPLCNVLLFQHVNMLPSLHFLEQSTSQSVSQFHRSIVSDSLRLHELKHTRPPCPSPTPGDYSNSHPSSWWFHQVGDAIQPSHPLSSPSPPAPNPSQHLSLFQWGKSSHEMAKVLEFQLHISPSNEHPGLISFRMDWLDLLAVQGTLKSLLQHHSSKASILQPSAFLTVQLTHPNMTTGKTIALTRRNLLAK